MLTVCCWRWGSKYPASHVDKLRAGVGRNLSVPHRFMVVTDQPRGGYEVEIDRLDLLSVRDGCYARLRMFDPRWRWDMAVNGPLVCLDLDLVITGDLDPLFDRPEPFVILHGGHFNPCPFNGSVMMLRQDAPREVWDRFTVEAAERVATADGTYRGTDQTWIAHTVPLAAGWTHKDGIYAYGKPGWPGGDVLPKDARIVAFPGSKDPSQMAHLPWVREHWRE